MSLFLLLVCLALFLAVIAAANKAPVWPAVFVLIVALLVRFWPS